MPGEEKEKPDYQELRDLFMRALWQRPHDKSIYWKVKGKGFAEIASMHSASPLSSMVTLYKPTYDIYYIRCIAEQSYYEYQQSPLTGDEAIYRLWPDGRIQKLVVKTEWEDV